MSLSPQQVAFVEAYLIDPNGEKAAIAAGYSPKTAASQASRLLRHVKVVAALEQRRTMLQVRTGITPEMVLGELAKLGFSDIRQVVQWRSNVTGMSEDEDGDPVIRTSNEVTVTNSDQLTPEAAAAVLEVSQSKDGALKVKMHDKLGALVKIGQHLGMFRPVGTLADPGKKEAAANAAHTAGDGTEWGDDLRRLN